MLKKFIIASLILSVTSFYGQQNFDHKQTIKEFLTPKRSVDISHRNTQKHSKLVAVGLNLSLGLFGVHRLYLGTAPKIPVIYTFTLGGGGFLMLTDLGVIIFTKDLEQFANNPQVIMWSTEPKKAQPID